MLRVSTPCASPRVFRVSSPADKENLRRQIVGLAVQRDTTSVKHLADRNSSATTRKTNISGSVPEQQNGISFISTDNAPNNTYIDCYNTETHIRAMATTGVRNCTQGKKESYDYKMPHTEPHETLRNALIRSKTTLGTDNKTKPKIVRFRMEDCTIGKQKVPIVNITDTNEVKHMQDGNLEIGQADDYEVRGSAIAVAKDGRKGLLAYKDICTETEKRQNSLQTSLKIFRRRIKLNQERFIQPNESITEDYVIHSRSPIFDMNAASSAQEDRHAMRVLSSDEHVRILRSALHNKHNGGTNAVKQTDEHETGDSYKTIKCSYRLPQNPNWGKEVSFKDIKDATIPSVKTYVLAEGIHPHVKFKKNNMQNSVTLNTHNLNVHNSITQIHGHKVKVGDSEVSFDPRFLDWLEDSFSNAKHNKGSTCMSDDTMECCTPVIKRRIAAKT